jgi:hypothetical protein
MHVLRRRQDYICQLCRQTLPSRISRSSISTTSQLCAKARPKPVRRQTAVPTSPSTTASNAVPLRQQVDRDGSIDGLQSQINATRGSNPSVSNQLPLQIATWIAAQLPSTSTVTSQQIIEFYSRFSNLADSIPNTSTLLSLLSDLKLPPFVLDAIFKSLLQNATFGALLFPHPHHRVQLDRLTWIGLDLGTPSAYRFLFASRLRCKPSLPPTWGLAWDTYGLEGFLQLGRNGGRLQSVARKEQIQELSEMTRLCIKLASTRPSDAVWLTLALKILDSDKTPLSTTEAEQLVRLSLPSGSSTLKADTKTEEAPWLPWPPPLTIALASNLLPASVDRNSLLNQELTLYHHGLTAWVLAGLGAPGSPMRHQGLISAATLGIKEGAALLSFYWDAEKAALEAKDGPRGKRKAELMSLEWQSIADDMERIGNIPL